MSLYSGKCDFGDTCEIHGIDNILKSKVYVGWNMVPLKMESEHDLVPYYPYLVAMSASENGVGTFHLTSESFIDSEERNRLEWLQKSVVKYVNQCKRRKEPIDMNFSQDDYYHEAMTEILQRVVDKNMCLEEIYLPMQEHYRKELYKEMLRVGWSEFEAKRWCFGWERINKKISV